MKKIITSNQSILTLGILFIFVLWYLVSLSFGVSNVIVPNPIEVISNFFYQLSRPYIYKSILWTLLRTFIGFGIAFVAAFILGSLSGNHPKVYIFLKPLLIVLKSAPTAIFVFLFLVLSGARFAPIFIVILLAFPILYESIVGGIKNIDKDVVNSSKVDGAKYFTRLFRIKLPLSLSYIAVGLASSFALSIKTSIMAEIITGDTEYGLGCAIRDARQRDPSDMTPLFAIALITIIIVMIFSLISYILKRRFKND